MKHKNLISNNFGKVKLPQQNNYKCEVLSFEVVSFVIFLYIKLVSFQLD